MRFSAEVFAVEDTASAAHLARRAGGSGGDHGARRPFDTAPRGHRRIGAGRVDRRRARTPPRSTASRQRTERGRSRAGRTRSARCPRCPAPSSPACRRSATSISASAGSASCRACSNVPEPPVPHTLRCASAAIEEWTRWGSQHVVFKGDLVDHGTRAEWDTLASSARNRAPTMDAHARQSRDDEAQPSSAAEDMLTELGLPTAPVRPPTCRGCASCSSRRPSTTAATDASAMLPPPPTRSAKPNCPASS